MSKRDEDAPSDDGIVAEDITQLIEHIELTGEHRAGSGPEWELATPAEELEDAPIPVDDDTRQLPDLEGMEVTEDIELFTETEVNLNPQLLLVEDEQLELELAAALAAERERWQQRVESLRAEMAEGNRLLAEGAQEIENLSARLASTALERERSTGQSDSTAEPRMPSTADSIIPGLHERLRERSRAALEMHETGARLRAEREQLVADIARRDRFIRRLYARLRKLERSDQGSVELHNLMRRFFGGDRQAEASASPVPAAEPLAPSVPEPALPADPAPRQVVVEDMRQALLRGDAPVAAQDEPRVRRYLIGIDMVGSVYEITQPRINVGRTRDNDLRIVDPTVSRLHAMIRMRGPQATVIDANSRNGVYVNGIQLRYATLDDGDTLTFGAVSFRYRVGSGSSGGDFGPD